MKKYPVWRVTFCFSFCPAIGGVWLMILSWSNTITIVGLEADKASSFIGAIAKLLFGSFVTGMYFYFIPAFAMSLIYAFMKLKRDWKGYLFVGVMGEIAVLSWTLLFMLLIPYRVVASAGMISSLIMARFALPLPEQEAVRLNAA